MMPPMKRHVWRLVFVACTAVLGACGSPCDRACELVNDLDCATCDCGACSGAPESCDSYFECINDSDSCFEIGLGCGASAECNAYINNQCG
jgi:hypothetical protein